jgi:ribonuclease D
MGAAKKLNDPTLVRYPRALQAMAEAAAQEPYLAVDTESNSLHAYRERVCLIQFSTPQTDYLVDPLALRDLSPLAPLFASPQIEKVFHAAEYDLICLKRDYGFVFENLFDTMLAARMLSWPEVGLGAILEREFGVKQDKRFQRADWGRRPLPPYLLNYARLDTHYLIELRHRQHAALAAAKRWELAQEDFKRLLRVEGQPHEENLDTCWQISGSHDLKPQQLAVLQELCLYRDQMARAMDRPLFKVMGNKTLVAIAETCPTTLDELSQLHGMTPHQVDRHGQAVLEAVARGQQAPAIYPERAHRPDERYLNRLEALREWRKATAQALGVESDIVLPKDLLAELAQAAPQTPEELAAVMQAAPWRSERYGQQILAALNPPPKAAPRAAKPRHKPKANRQAPNAEKPPQQ